MLYDALVIAGLDDLAFSDLREPILKAILADVRRDIPVYGFPDVGSMHVSAEEREQYGSALSAIRSPDLTSIFDDTLDLFSGARIRMGGAVFRFEHMWSPPWALEMPGLYEVRSQCVPHLCAQLGLEERYRIMVDPSITDPGMNPLIDTASVYDYVGCIRGENVFLRLPNQKIN